MRLLHIKYRTRSWLRLGGLIFVTLLVHFGGGRTACGEEMVSRSHRMSQIAAGTVVEDSITSRWNRVVLLARPRISSGDVDSLMPSVRNSVSEFVLTIMASIESTKDEASGELQYRLADVGVGYSAEVNGVLKVVTVNDAAKVGVDLGLFNRMILSENEKQLKTVTIIARTSTLMIIDAPAFVLRDGGHRAYTMRHFVWVDTRSGRNAALVWLIDRQSGRGKVEAAEPLRWATAGLQEDRAIHVDGREFNMLGIPNEKAFAIEQLPPGKSIPWTEQLKPLAALDTYSADALRALSAALNDALQSYARQ